MRIVLLIVTMLCWHLSGAKTYSVNVNPGSLSLKSAIATCQDYDTIQLRSGTYKVQRLEISKPLTIIGIGFPILDGEKKDEVLLISSNHVNVVGLEIRNSKMGSMKDYAGIRVFRCSDVTINNCRLRDTFFGIYLSDSKNIKVTDNTLSGANYGKSDTGNGIHLWKCEGIEIKNNSIEGHRDGIYLEFAKHCAISKNHCFKNFRYGLHFMFSDNDTYTENNFERNGTGVAVMYSKGVCMYRNNFMLNWGDASYGLLLKDMTGGIIQGNHFVSNTIAITMEGSNRMTITNNTISRNGYGLKIMADCQLDSVMNNNFTGNTFDVATNGTLNNNHFSNNYWDKYEGYDLNRDKIGDVPFQPISLFSVIVEQMPYAVMLMRSFTVELLDRAEKNIPSLVPETIQDNAPRMVSNK